LIDLPETDKIRLQESNAALKRALMIDNISDTLIPAWVDDTLTPVEKLLVHQRGLRHLAVSVFLLSGPDVLIQRRALGKYHTPGLWANTCCIHPHWGEDPMTCAHRRLEQEMGIVDVTLLHRDVIEYRADVGSGLIEHEVVDLFVAHVDRGIELSPNPNEVMETNWISIDDLRCQAATMPHKFTPWLRIYLAQHADKIFL
jgi:isopentenyl-diphosphate delta-isomerase